MPQASNALQISPFRSQPWQACVAEMPGPDALSRTSRICGAKRDCEAAAMALCGGVNLDNPHKPSILAALGIPVMHALMKQTLDGRRDAALQTGVMPSRAERLLHLGTKCMGPLAVGTVATKLQLGARFNTDREATAAQLALNAGMWAAAFRSCS